MRQYQIIWEAVKKDKKAVLAAKPHLHQLIMQAVRKERWLDIAYKLQASEAGMKERLDSYSNAERGIITFKLVDSSIKGLAEKRVETKKQRDKKLLDGL